MSSVRALDDQPGSGGTLDTVTREAAGTVDAPASNVGGSRGTGLVIGLLSAAAFGTSGTFGTSLIGAGWSPAGAVLARVSIAALVLTGPALVQLRGRWALLRRWGWRTVAYGCVGVAACQLGYFNAISRMPVGIALLIEYMGILLVVGWLWVRHGQRPRRLTIAGSAAAIGGLALMLDLSGPGGISPVGVLWALLAAVSMAVYFILSAKAGADPLPPVVMTWGGMIVGRGRARRGRRDRAGAAGGLQRGRDAAEPPGELAGAGPRAVGAGGCLRVRHGHRSRPAARGQARVVRRAGGGPVRHGVRLGAAAPGADHARSSSAGRSS